MSWLRGVENRQRDKYLRGEIIERLALDQAIEDGERMARVIRELAGHIQDVRAWAKHAGIYLVEGDVQCDIVLEDLRKRAADSWDNLSSDSKDIVG